MIPVQYIPILIFAALAAAFPAVIFWALVETKHYILAVLAVAYLTPAVYYYFRMVAAMWVRDAGEEPSPIITAAQKFALGAMAGVTLLAGIFPEQFLRFASYSILNPFQR